MMTQQPLHELGCAQVTDYIIQVQQREESAQKAEGEKAAVTEFAGKASAVDEHEVNSTLRVL